MLISWYEVKWLEDIAGELIGHAFDFQLNALIYLCVYIYLLFFVL